MLARMIVWVCVCVTVVTDIQAEDVKPNVVVILADDHIQEVPKTTAHGVLDNALFTEAVANAQVVGWRGYRSDCRISPSRAAAQAAILYGMSPLGVGVVSDTDWRRRPVVGESLLDIYRRAGYEIHRYGEEGREGGAQNTLNAPWGSAKPAEVVVQEITAAFLNDIKSEKPWIVILRQGEVLQDEVLARLMQDQLIPAVSKSTRPTIVLILRPKSLEKKRGGVDAIHHYPADWYLYHYGKGGDFNRHVISFRPAETDWELHTRLINLAEKMEPQRGEFRFFHKANWPTRESPDKYRHRGSLVIGKGHALVDGLELYPVTQSLEPDFTKPLDIAGNQQLHAEMLTAHARWWQNSRKALYDPRAFDVGKVDGESVQLTAMDWRPSKIIHKDGTSANSKPIFVQAHLLGILSGLQEKNYRNAFPAYSGSWAVNVKRPGRYKITASLLPKEAQKPEEKNLARLQGGQAFFKLGRNQVQLNLLKGASAVSAHIDSDTGGADLECWFTGQLALERELGAFFVEIERVGDKKFDLKAKAK